MCKAGRPRSTHCKRGHERVPGEYCCLKCRRYRERLRYDTNPDFRQKKIDYAVQWKRAFVEANGFHYSELYDRKAA